MSLSIHQYASGLNPRSSKTFTLLYRDASAYLVLLMPVAVFLYNVVTGFGAADVDLSDSSGNAIQQVMTFIILANGILLVFLFGISLRTIALSLLPAAPLIFWMLLSIGWSDFPLLT